MASPKSTPIRITGRKLTTGPVADTPNTSDSQPHWKTATTAAKEAATDIRNPSVALTGITSDRKTTSSRTSDSPTTTAANVGSEERNRSETSMPTAVLPVT